MVTIFIATISYLKALLVATLQITRNLIILKSHLNVIPYNTLEHIKLHICISFYASPPTKHIHSASAANVSPTYAFPACFIILGEIRKFVTSILTLSPGRT